MIRTIARRRDVVLFDLDGTLSHSEPGICGTLKLAIAQVGLPVPSDDALRTAIGPPFTTGLPDIGIPADRVDDITAAYRAIYEDTGLFDTTLYPGITELLDELAEAGRTLCVATSKPESSARRVIEHFDLTDRFKVIGAASDDYLLHTKADVIATVLDRLGLVGGEEIIMVGDRRYDVESAAAHSIDTIGVLWGYGSRAELETAGTWSIAEQPSDVGRLVA